MDRIKELIKTNNIVKISLILVLVIIVLLSSTLAYYGWGSTANTNVTFSVIEDMVYITYESGPDISATLQPVSDKSLGIEKDIKIKVDRNKEKAKVNLYLDINTLPDELKEESFRYALYQGNTLKTSGNFANYTSSTCTVNSTNHIVLLSNFNPTTTQTTFKLYIWIDGANYTNPDDMMNQEFSFTLHADGVGVVEATFLEQIGEEAPIDTDSGVDFSITSELNNTNGLYTLSSTQNDAYPIVYYRGGGTDTTTGEELVKNNLIFADTCWKIVRTTSTGGLRLIYNGTPLNGTCSRPNNTDNGRSASTTTYNISSTSNYYYGTSYTFNETSGLYSLSGTISSGTWASDKVGLYTCFATSQTSTCTSLRYLNSYNSATQAGVYTYTSTSNASIGTKDFNSSYNSLAYVGYMYGTVYTRASGTGTGWYYAPDVTYSNGTYTLTANASYNVETKDTISGTNLNYQHYTCGSSTDTTCTSVRYVYYVSSSTAYYITLTEGDKVEDALSKMLDYNTTSSTIKGNGTSATTGTIDYWYKNTISGTSYESKIDKNEIFCNDRSIYALNGWNPNGGSTTEYLFFGAYGRLDRTPVQYTPTLTCARDIDKFTVSTATTGNKALTYPVGLLTADETSLAGGSSGIDNTNYYLYTGQSWWTMSPYRYGFTGSYPRVYIVTENGGINWTLTSNKYGVRPVLSLAKGYIINDGDGSTTNPYIVS